MNSAADVLREKKSELLADLARLKGDAREAGEAQVRDATDEAVGDEESGDALEEATQEARTLEQVEDALRRVADGTYGKCVVCGRAISAARLKAIPWTPYCLEDQAKKPA